MGILFAFGALFSWGIGDFLIQRSARRFGDWVALFFITTFAAVVLFPFIYSEIGPLFTQGGLALVLLLLATFVIFIASLLDLEALRVGKISVIEPIYAFEVPVTALLGTLVIREVLASSQILFIVILVAGLFLVSIRSLSHFKNIKIESGVLLTLSAALCMGTANFLFGLASRASSPLLVNWFASTFIATVCLIYLTLTSRLPEITGHWRTRKKLILSVSLIDNLAWVFFSYSTLYIPIAIATGISESYVALAAFLGIVLNQEKLKPHQVVGIVLAVAGVTALSLLTP